MNQPTSQYPLTDYPLPWTISCETRSEAERIEIARERAEGYMMGPDGERQPDREYEEAYQDALAHTPETVYVIRDAEGFPIGIPREDLSWLLAWLPSWMLAMPQDRSQWGVQHSAALEIHALLNHLYLECYGVPSLTSAMGAKQKVRNEQRWPHVVAAIKRWREEGE